MSGAATEDAALVRAARAIAPVVRGSAEQTEREQRLPQPLVDAMVDAGVFRMLVPRALGEPRSTR